MSDGWLCSLSRPLQPVVGAPTIRTYVLTITRTLPIPNQPSNEANFRSIKSVYGSGFSVTKSATSNQESPLAATSEIRVEQAPADIQPNQKNEVPPEPSSTHSTATSVNSMPATSSTIVEHSVYAGISQEPITNKSAVSGVPQIRPPTRLSASSDDLVKVVDSVSTAVLAAKMTDVRGYQRAETYVHPYIRQPRGGITTGDRVEAGAMGFAAAALIAVGMDIWNWYQDPNKTEKTANPAWGK